MILNFTDEQREIIEAPIKEKTIVVANAASGKTFVLVERLKFLINQGVDPSKIVCITFTNNSANEMRIRLGEYDHPDMFVGTIHSYANHLLMKGGVDTSMQLRTEEFDELFEMIGENRHVVQEIDYLLCDESQDLDPYQFEFIVYILNAPGALLVGDPKQSIYGFRGADPYMLDNLRSDMRWTTRVLMKNFRNAIRINNLANNTIKEMRGFDKIPSVITRKERGEIHYYPFLRLARTLEENAEGNYKEWAVLCRSNSQVNAVQNMLKTAGIPTITFKQAENSLEELDKKRNTNSVKVLTIHSAKGLEFDNVMLADRLQMNKNGEGIRLFYVALTRARDRLFLRR